MSSVATSEGPGRGGPAPACLAAGRPGSLGVPVAATIRRLSRLVRLLAAACGRAGGLTPAAVISGLRSGAAPPPGNAGSLSREMGACCVGGGARGRGRRAPPTASVVGAWAGSCGRGCITRCGPLTASAMRRPTSSSVREGRPTRGGAAPADGVSCRSSPGLSRCMCTVRSRTTLRLTQWTATGRRPGGGATVPKAALTTAHAASACVWATKVRYGWFSPP